MLVPYKVSWFHLRGDTIFNHFPNAENSYFSFVYQILCKRSQDFSFTFIIYISNKIDLLIIQSNVNTMFLSLSSPDLLVLSFFLANVTAEK